MKNKLLKYEDTILRVLQESDDSLLVINCTKCQVPHWMPHSQIDPYEICTEEDLLSSTDMMLPPIEELDSYSSSIAHKRFTLIAGILPFIGDDRERKRLMSIMAEQEHVSRQTIKNYLWLYLSYQTLSVLAPKPKGLKRELTLDEKNMRWALNKFFYTKHKNSIMSAYTFMLKEKYCDNDGNLLPEHPTIHQFRYFYNKTKKLQTYYISRDGIKHYQRNNRPLLGDGVQEYAPTIGIGMLDATVCDIYLVDESGSLIGRPILTACVDAYSGLCCGYSLTWEGGTYSLLQMMLNVVTDKKAHCKKFGIKIPDGSWDCNSLPATLVTDGGSEYRSKQFSQITECGVTLVNLQSYRPELKGIVEKFFDVLQNLFKSQLKGKGVIEPDYQERGAHDYRKDACLTLGQFETILLHCMVYYNSKRVLTNYPYTTKMLESKIAPHCSDIWNYGVSQTGSNLIPISAENLMLHLLPRTEGRFTRQGLNVNGIRYKNQNFTEKYLSGGIIPVAFNPDDVSKVWLIENHSFIPFSIIEKRYKEQTLSDVNMLKASRKKLIQSYQEDNLQAKIELTNHIEAISTSGTVQPVKTTKDIRKTRAREQLRTHKNPLKGAATNESD